MKNIIFINMLIGLSLFSAEYKTIENQAVRVVYEEGLESQAKEVANNIERLKTFYEGEHKGLLKQIPLILRKDDLEPNAYFSPLNQKMEFITAPMLDDAVGTTPWLTALSIHEYRHYTQNKLAADNTPSKMIYVLGGENLRASFLTLTIPQWFDEGDAVYYETKLSNNGRGRTPNFLKEYRALLAENKEFSYEKAKNGSYKDYVPNHYYLGYLMVSYGYEKYGDKFWNKILDLTGSPKKIKGFKNPYTPLSNALKAKTGLTSEEFYREALKYYGDKFKAEKKIEYENVNKKSDVPTNYTFPYETKEGILALKKSSNEWTSLYKIKDGQEEKVINFGYMTYNYYSVRDNMVIWSEIEPDLTNSKKNYSNIKTYDLETKKKINLTNKSCYFFPRLSRDKKLIVTIYSNSIEETKIHILDSEGKLIKELPNIENYQYSSIDWSKDNKELIVGLRDKDGRMGLISINLENYDEKVIMPFNNYILGTVNVNDDNVFFTGSFDYISNEYRLNMKDGKIYKLTSSNIGTSGGTVIGGELYFSEYSANGYNLKKSSDITGEEITPKSLLDSEKLNTDNFKNPEINLINNKEEKEYSEKKYNYFKHMIKPNGWHFIGSENSLDLGVTSENELEDFNLSVNYVSEFDETKDENTFSIEGELTKYWPNMNFSYEAKSEINNQTKAESDSEDLRLGLSFPMNFSKNENLRTSNLKLNYYDYFNENETQYSINYKIVNSKYPARKDIVTDGSQMANVLYRTDLKDNSKLNLNLALTTKGFSENDGFKYQITSENDKGNLKHNDDEVISRGYEDKSYDKALKNSIDYYIPLYYPDFGKAGFYFNRVKTDIFYDNTKLDNKDTYSSIGNKLSLEGKIDALINFETSIQYSYLLDEKDYKVELAFQIEY